MQCLFSTAYFPPISYFSVLLKADQVLIEQHEHYIKQTYRNRTEIYGANGMLSLTIPVDHHDLFAIPIKEVRISYEQPWQKIHWRSIESAYRNSPYFEYYEDELKVFYEKKYELLLEWNNDLLITMLRIVGIEKMISFTELYIKEYEGILPQRHGDTEKNYSGVIDFRNEFMPGKKSISTAAHPTPYSPLPTSYKQVFSDRYGFIADLSIIDLLFNEGPKALDIIEHR